MNSLLEDEEDDPPSAHELTLGTGTILGIFFGIVILCGLFFGFGYKMGDHKPVQPPVAATAAPSTANFDSFKPAAGSPINTTSPPPTAHATAPPKIVPNVQEPEPTHLSSALPPQTPAQTTSAIPPAGSFVVQVAAFTHPEDAELLVHALKVKGYPAFARGEPEDKLQHIQVGPFASRKDAEAARQKLLADGYQPILR